MGRSEVREAPEHDDIPIRPIESAKARRETDDAGWGGHNQSFDASSDALPRLADTANKGERSDSNDPDEFRDSLPPNRHEGQDDREQPTLTNDQSEFVGSEVPTNVGSAFFYPDDIKYRQAAKEVPPYPGEYVVDSHGTPESVQLKDSDGNLRELNAPEFADVLRTTGWDGEPVRLFACDTGQRSDGFAQQLANDLNVPVTAPTEAVSTVTDAHGNTYEPEVGKYTYGMDPKSGDIVKTWVPGEWITYLPDARDKNILEQG